MSDRRAIEQLTHVSVSSLKQLASHLVPNVATGERLVVTHMKLPVAALIPMSDLEKLLAYERAEQESAANAVGQKNKEGAAHRNSLSDRARMFHHHGLSEE